MPTRRVPIHRDTRRVISPDMREKIKRVIVLRAAHMAAIEGGPQDFYDNGEHQELVDLMPEVSRALGLKPWIKPDQALKEALEE